MLLTLDHKTAVRCSTDSMQTKSVERVYSDQNARKAKTKKEINYWTLGMVLETVICGWHARHVDVVGLRVCAAPLRWAGAHGEDRILTWESLNGNVRVEDKLNRRNVLLCYIRLRCQMQDAELANDVFTSTQVLGRSRLMPPSTKTITLWLAVIRRRTSPDRNVTI